MISHVRESQTEFKSDDSAIFFYPEMDPQTSLS